VQNEVNTKDELEVNDKSENVEDTNGGKLKRGELKVLLGETIEKRLREGG